MTQYNTENPTYTIRVETKDSTTYSFPYVSFDEQERDNELERVDALIETGCRFVRIGNTRFPVDRIIHYCAYNYSGHLNGGSYWSVALREADDDNA